MTEIQRDARSSGAGDAAPEPDREAKIEQLLLVGLDHYFAAEYEQAINVWTRVLFLDRSHARARAYIERARSALAERLRQSEELLHDGVAAFQRGEGHEARRLLQAAIDGGAPAEEALAVLDRLNRLELPPVDSSQSRRRETDRTQRETAPRPSRARRALTMLAVLVAAILVAGAYAVSTHGAGWSALAPFVSFAEPSSGVGPPPVAQDLSLPLPRRGEIALAKGRALAASGRLHEALAVLDQVRPTDPQREEADRLRADIQRQLLALTPMPAAPAPPDARVP